MRMYFFSNLYISSIQHGIQGMHSFGEMVLEYALDPERPNAEAERQILRTFLRDHKTAIVLNGGYASTLAEIHQRLGEIAEDWPATNPLAGCLLYAKFHEEEAALNGALTSVAAIVPACSYFDSKVPGRAEARTALRLKMTEAGYMDCLEAAFARNVFTPEERLALLCMAFPLAQ